MTKVFFDIIIEHVQNTEAGDDRVSGNDRDMRNCIIETAIEIIKETPEIERITVRQIAQRAGVGIGLINYYFESKDHLLSIAIGEVLSKLASDLTADRVESDEETDPVSKLKRMIKLLYAFSAEYESLIKFSLLQCILNGDMGAELSIVPILREIFKDDADEMRLRIIALQIIQPIQAVSLTPSAFHMYSGIDIYNEKERDKFVDTLIDNII